MIFRSAYVRLGKAVVSARRARLLAATGVAGLVAAAPVLPVFAQIADPVAGQMDTSFGAQSGIGAGSQMLLEADELTYDFDRETVTATGGVQINYGKLVLDADRLTYDQRSGRLIASGGVRILEPGGNLIVADTLDITDDFADGFIESLNVFTIDRARFAAQAAERRGGNLMIFRKGVYTACEPCAKHPERPPLWQVKASRIIQDNTEKTIYYENARLEFYGVPVAYMPFFSHPDPTVKRKSGFLTPSYLQSDAIGFGVTTPYFWNLAPDYDLTLSPTFLTRQGLLMQTEWRQRLLSGSYSIQLAGIFQLDKEAFSEGGNELSGYETFRGSVHSVGAFAFNQRWSYGWDINGVTDRTFNRDYLIPYALAQDLTSTVYLTGLSERNFFDARAYQFLVQREDTLELDSSGQLRAHSYQAEQPIVHPVIDHNYILDTPVLGGEVKFDSNLTSLTRAESDIQYPPDPLPNQFYAGYAGTFTRATSRGSWERQFIAPGGQLVTPFAYLQADTSLLAFDEPALAGDSTELTSRVMPAVGVEYEYPILATLGSTVHTFGPKAQLIVRPNETHIGDIPNEDAQSLVFDDTSLFEWDKFSGYDRQEGGTRANVALVYHGLFPNGASVDALAGQSYQLDGENSFATLDNTLTGVGSGLDADVSDYVGRVTVNTGLGVAMTARGRFDSDDLTVNRSELSAVGSLGKNVASVGYAYIRQTPGTGIYDNRQEVNGAASIALPRNWSVLASAVYDVENNSGVSQSLGLSYNDECFDLSAVYTETNAPYSDLVASRQIFLKINLRTLGGQTFTRPLSVEN